MDLDLKDKVVLITGGASGIVTVAPVTTGSIAIYAVVLIGFFHSIMSDHLRAEQQRPRCVYEAGSRRC